MNKSRFSIALTAFLLLTGCSSQDPETSPISSSQVISINLGSEPKTLDPRQPHEITLHPLLQTLFEGLTRIGPDGTPHLSMAKSVDVSVDKLTYIFHLRECLWSNGEKVTAHDFTYAWRSILEPNSNKERAQPLYILKNAQAVHEGDVDPEELGLFAPDDNTLIVALKHPTPYFLELIASPLFFPVNASIAAKNKEWSKSSSEFVSNGPFTLKEWLPGKTITMQKNNSYWDAANVQLREIHALMITDSKTELALYQQGQLDWTNSAGPGLPNEEFTKLQEKGELQVEPLEATYLYLFNTKKPPFNNSTLRKALSYAINREAITHDLKTLGVEPATSALPKNLSTQTYNYFSSNDLERAKFLFRQALLEMDIKTEDLPTITITLNADPGQLEVAKAVQRQWNETFGIDVQIEQMDQTAYLKKINQADYQIGRLGYVASIKDPTDLLERYMDANDDRNNTKWSNIAYTTLLQEVQQTADSAERSRLLHRAERLLLDEMPIAPIFHRSSLSLKNNALQGVFLSGAGQPEFKWSYLTID